MTTAYDDLLLSLGLEPSGEAPKAVAECGTHSGYTAHRREDQEPCRPCRDANAAYKRRRMHAPKEPALLPPINHGTHNGARQHYYRGEKPCEPCRDAYNADRGPKKRGWRARAAARKAGKK